MMSSSYPDEEDVDVVTFLQRAGVQYRDHIKMMQHEKKLEEMNTLRSKPVICQYERITDRDRGVVGPRLHKLWDAQLQKTEARRKEIKSEELAVTDTFQPKISSKARALGPRDQGHVSQDFLSKHKKKIENLRNEALKKELEEVIPNRPNMVSRSRSATATETDGDASAADHRQGLKLEDWLLMKEKERQRKLYEQVEEENNPEKHHPHISERARKVERPGNFVNRLYDPNYRPLVYDENAPTFRPNIHSGDYDDPLADQPVYERVMNREVKHHSRIANVDRTPRGRPILDETSQRLVATRRSRSTQNDTTNRSNNYSYRVGESTIQASPDAGSVQQQPSPGSRLYAEGTKAVQEKDARDAEARDVKNRFSYRPQISKESQRIIKSKRSSSAAAAPVDGAGDDRLYNRWKRQQEDKQQKIAKARAEKEKENMAECTFTPFSNISQSPIDASGVHDRSHASNFDGWMDKSTLWEKNRKKRLEEEALEKESEKMSECTFQPLIHHEVPLPVSTNKATGYNHHIDRLAKARKQRDEAVDQVESGSTTPRRAGGRKTPAKKPKVAPGLGHRNTRPITQHGVTPFSHSRHIDPGQINALKAPVNRQDIAEPFYDEYEEEDGHPPMPLATAAPHPQEYHHESRASAGPQQGFHTPKATGRSQSHASNAAASRRSTSTHQAPQAAPLLQDYYGGAGGSFSQAATGRTHSAAANPSPVDFILENHNAIKRGFHRNN